jgi:hypothetical protein
MRNTLIHILDNPLKYKHHKRIIRKLIDKNILMNDLMVSDKGGCIQRDSEIYTAEMNRVLRMYIKKG